MDHIQRIAYLRDLPGETISPAELAKVYGGNPYTYNISAKEGKLPFPYLWRGRNLRIIKQAVIDFLVGRNACQEHDTEKLIVA